MAAFYAPDPGELREKVTLLLPQVDGVDENGNPMIAPRPLCSGWRARWLEGPGSDVSSGEEERHLRTAEIVMRYASGVVSMCSVLREGDALPWQVVSAVDPTGRREWLVIAAEQAVLR